MLDGEIHRDEEYVLKSSKSSRVECLMERYIEMKSTCSALYLVNTGPVLLFETIRQALFIQDSYIVHQRV